MTGRDENNRKLAEWVGWTTGNVLVVNTRGNPGLVAGWWNPQHDSWSEHLPDFLHDEAANALLLEKMATIYPDEYIHLEHLKYIGWIILSCHGYKGVTHADRKTAIVNAALALIARQG